MSTLLGMGSSAILLSWIGDGIRLDPSEGVDSIFASNGASGACSAWKTLGSLLAGGLIERLDGPASEGMGTSASSLSSFRRFRGSSFAIVSNAESAALYVYCVFEC